MFRSTTFALPSLLLAAACAAGSSPTPPPGAATPPGPSRPVTSNDQQATALGVAIMSNDPSGAPRLIRSIVPRAARAGIAPELVAREHVAALAPLWIQQASPMALVETGTQPLRNGATVVKLAQHIDGVLVEEGEMHVLMYDNGSLAAVSGTLLAQTIKPVFVSSPREAVSRALDQLYGTARPQPAITVTGTAGGWDSVEVAADPQLAISAARARREITNVDGKQTEAWLVELTGNAPPDRLRDASISDIAAHRYLFTDAGGTLVSDVDLVKHDAFVYRAYADTTGNRRPLDGPLESFAPHPTGIPDGSAPGVIPSSLVVMEAFNGPHDKWLPDDATTTAGNNAEAFADLDATLTFTPGDIRPEVRAGRTLNYTYDQTISPLATVTQSKAAAVNVFFVVNWLHDWWYDSGFTEATGTGQLDNFGRGGVANDRLLITAQAGANTGLRNNADMTTPGDGARPRMRMFLWTAGTDTAITAPTVDIRDGENFVAGPRAFDLTAELVAGVDGTAPTNDGCQRPTNVAGKIALLTYTAQCGSLDTVNNAKAGGAIGVILADGELENPRSFAGSAAANIPGLAIGKSRGDALQAALVNGPVTVTLHSEIVGVERDGDLDNGIVAHEWGHYMHHRLSNCVSGPCNGMSEGWGDFNALLLMLREGENRDGVYAMGPYALADGTPDTAYFGIRRFPYSTDRTKNALSFRHIGDENPLPTTTPGFPGGPNSEVHNTGEIWATMLWDVLNVLADEHGVVVARRRMTDYMVGGLLLSPRNPSFTEARDAILAAASALDTDDMTLMAAAFAGRGAGSCAVSPPITSATNAGVVESGTLAAILQVGGVSLTDDGISCDHDGILDPGESGQLRVTVANNGLFSADDVSVTATTASPGVRIGTPLQIPTVAPHSSLSLSIPVTLLATAPRNTSIAITVHVAGLNTCTRDGITVALSVPTGIDEVAAASTIDHVQTTITPWTKTGTGAADLWSVATDTTGNKSWFGRNLATTSDTQLVSPALLASATEPFVVKFLHAFDLESRFDGGVIELSTNGGMTWTDAAALGVTPGYTATLFTGANPIGGRPAFTGTSPGFPTRAPVTLNFGTRFAGQSVLLRFRLGTDISVARTGWSIDEIELSGITNTPFPALVVEPSTCTARKGAVEDSTVLAVHEAPATSLAAFDAAVCIATDTP